MGEPYDSEADRRFWVAAMIAINNGAARECERLSDEARQTGAKASAAKLASKARRLREEAESMSATGSGLVAARTERLEKAKRARRS